MIPKVSYKVLLNELVSVSFKDSFISSIDKWKAHTNQYIKQQNSMPHRAFSIFLFNSKNQLLFQRRSIQKKTFPLCWTNTCCSHPNMIQTQNKKIQVQPIREALHRAIHRELNLDLTKEKFSLVDKILYKALGQKNQIFGEYELDYVFLCKVNTPDVNFKIVEEEICEVEWVKQQNLQKFINQKLKVGCYFSPWFLKMHKNGLLNQWWKAVIEGKVKDLNQKDIEIKNYL